MQKVVVLGVGMTKFGKHSDKSLKDLGKEALTHAVQDANIELSQIEAAYVGNAGAGLITGQECIRGQVILSSAGLSGIPIINTENACASGSTAFHLAWMAVASGLYDIVLALGAEKMFHPEKNRVFSVLESSTDIEQLSSFPGYGEHKEGQSIFMDLYAWTIKNYMTKYDIDERVLAKIAVKNSYNGSLNPYAQYQKAQSLEEVLESRIISDPLRLKMCSPISDGAAAAIICSEKAARLYTNKPVYVAASVLTSGSQKQEEMQTVERASRKAFELANIGPKDLRVVEVHDAAASGELLMYDQLGLCSPGEGARLIESGATKIGGKIPVNPSGGLISRGHPIGATGIAQIAEITWQLRGQAGARQIPNQPKVGLTENAGGYLNGDNGATCIHIFKL
ncbi:thiolase family protein [Brevibacillus sp. NRS-1366]|uniref:thiolase family protein n=1 Tax=Brevibacillus sp. NRS-1366 TaxID=3233899 RepID=UPI003D2598C2